MVFRLSLAILALLAICLACADAGDRLRIREKRRTTTTTYGAPVYLGTNCAGQQVYGCVGTTTTVRTSVRVRGGSCVGSSCTGSSYVSSRAASCVGSGCTGTVRTRTTYSSSWR